MKKFLLVVLTTGLFISLITAIPGYCQERPSKEQMRERMIERMTERLELTEQQKKKLEKIMNESKDFRDIRKNMETILTDKQKKKLEEMQGQRSRRGQGDRLSKEERIERRIKRMAEELNLSKEQQDKIKEIYKEGGEPKDIRNKINEILTKEQQKKFKKLDFRSGRRRRDNSQRIERRIKRMTEDLNLSKEQQKEIKKILSEGGRQKDIKKKINKVLTKEQREKQKEIDKKLMGRRKNR